MKKKIRAKFIRILAKIIVFFKVVGKNHRYRRGFILIGLCTILAIGIIVAACNGISRASKKKTAANEAVTYRENETSYEETVSTVTADMPSTIENSDEISENSEYTGESDPEWDETLRKLEKDADDALWYGAINVDVEMLKEVNDDVVGWIYFEAADISYPVLQGTDNDEYLRTNYEGKHETAGSIILETLNSSDFSDRHTIIYGHNRRNLAMFGQLKYYRDEADYYSNHQYFQLIIPGENGDIIKYRYHIFACRDVSLEDDAYYIFDESYTEISNFADTVLRKDSYIDTTDEIEITDEDYIVTLSTCSSKADRLLLSAVRCSECVISRNAD